MGALSFAYYSPLAVSLSNLTATYAKVGDSIGASVTNLPPWLSVDSWDIKLDGVSTYDETDLPLTVPDNAGETLEFIPTVDGVSRTDLASTVYIGKAPTISVLIDQLDAEQGDRLGIELTVSAEFIDVGYPVLDLDTVTVGWKVNNVTTAAGTALDYSDVVVGTASISSLFGTVTGTSDPLVVADTIAPTLAPFIEQPTISEGFVLGVDITGNPNITYVGYPPLAEGDLTEVWLVNDVVTTAGGTVTYGDVVKVRYTGDHPSGAISATSTGVTVPAFAAPTVTPFFVPQTIADGDVLTASDFGFTIDDPGYPPLVAAAVTKSVIKSGSAVTIPYTVVSGDSLTARATYTHPYYGGSHSDSTAALVASAAIAITALSVGTQQTDGTLPITYTVGSDTAADWIIYQGTDPTPTQLLAGTNGDDIAADATGSLTLKATADTTNSAALPANLEATYKFAILTNGSSIVVVRGNIAIDTRPPVLSSPSGSATGPDTASGSVSTNEARGTLYGAVFAAAATPLTAEIKAGTGALYATSKAVTATGAQAFTADGLPASTSGKWHYVQNDGFNDSAIATSASFSTDAISTSLIDFSVAPGVHLNGTTSSITGGLRLTQSGNTAQQFTWAVSLVGGQEYQLTVTLRFPTPAASQRLIRVGTSSTGGDGSLLSLNGNVLGWATDGSDINIVRSFTPATSGTYYVGGRVDVDGTGGQYFDWVDAILEAI